jgi:hypothetical protein
MDNPSSTTSAMSRPKAAAIAALVRLRNQTSTPWISFHEPRAARPAKAASPTTALIWMPELRGQDLSSTAYSTKVRPSRRKDKAERERRVKINARRGTRVATTTEVIGELLEEAGGRERKREVVARNTKAGDNTLIRKIGRDDQAIAVVAIVMSEKDSRKLGIVLYSEKNTCCVT